MIPAQGSFKLHCRKLVRWSSEDIHNLLGNTCIPWTLLWGYLWKGRNIVRMFFHLSAHISLPRAVKRIILKKLSFVSAVKILLEMKVKSSSVVEKADISTNLSIEFNLKPMASRLISRFLIQPVEENVGFQLFYELIHY